MPCGGCKQRQGIIANGFRKAASGDFRGVGNALKALGASAAADLKRIAEMRQRQEAQRALAERRRNGR